MNRTRIIVLGLTAGVAIISGAVYSTNKSSKSHEAAPAQSALTVTTTSPDTRNWPQTMTATGNVQAWQEAIIGAEVSGLRLAEVSANVGDAVQKGQVLARFADEMVVNELEQSRAAVDEARARLTDAEAKEASAKKLKESGMMSAQATIQNLAAAEVARAQLQTAQARLQEIGRASCRERV